MITDYLRYSLSSVFIIPALFVSILLAELKTGEVIGHILTVNDKLRVSGSDSTTPP